MASPTLRARRLARLALSVLVLALPVLLGPTAAAALRPAPCAVPEPTSARGWQAAFDGLNDSTWSGGDQGASLRLPDGRVLWVFADSFRGAQRTDGSRAPGSSFVRNSLVLSDRGCLRGVTGRGGAEVVPGTADGQWFWPQHAVLDRGRLFLSVLRVARTPSASGAAGFRTTGTWLAELSYAPGGTPSFRGLHRTPSSGTADTAVQWGTAVASSEGWTYVYGTRRVPVPGVFGKALHVARVPAGRLTDLRAWRYWDGRAWVAGAGRAATVRDAVGGVSTSLSVWRSSTGQWRAVTKKDEFLGRDVVLLRAPSPAGPWTEQVVGSSPSGRRPGETTYTALAHPDLALRGGALLVSVSRNDDDWDDHLADADLCKPQFTEARLR